jgi:hypothetical protein
MSLAGVDSHAIKDAAEGGKMETETTVKQVRAPRAVSSPDLLSYLPPATLAPDIDQIPQNNKNYQTNPFVIFRFAREYSGFPLSIS